MYYFTPPTEQYRVGTDSLWGRVKNDRGRAVVVYDDGRIVTVQMAPSHTDDGVVSVWPGGRTYEITDEFAAQLIDAGYSQNVEVVS